MRYFLLLLITIVVGFAFSFNDTVRDNSYDFNNIGLSLFSQYRMIFGEFDLVFGDLGSLEDESMGLFVLSRVLYVGFSFSITLILLNLLIALMGSSFARVQQNSELEWRYELLAITQEIEANFIWLDYISINNIFGWTKKQVEIEKKEFNPKWIQVVMSKENPVLVNNEVIVDINESVNSLSKQTSKKFQLMQNKMDDMQRENRRNIEFLQEENRKNIESLQEDNKQLLNLVKSLKSEQNK